MALISLLINLLYHTKSAACLRFNKDFITTTALLCKHIMLISACKLAPTQDKHLLLIGACIYEISEEQIVVKN